MLYSERLTLSSHYSFIIYDYFLCRKNGSAATRELLKGDPDAHNFQEYTYKKITPCDVCSQVLRGKINCLLNYE